MNREKKTMIFIWIFVSFECLLLSFSLWFSVFFSPSSQSSSTQSSQSSIAHVLASKRNTPETLRWLEYVKHAILSFYRRLNEKIRDKHIQLNEAIFSPRLHSNIFRLTIIQNKLLTWMKNGEQTTHTVHA